MLADGTVLVSTVGTASDGPDQCGGGTCGTLFFFACPDPLHNPTRWEYRSRIDYTNAMGPSGVGPNEHDITELDDGRVLVVFRLDSNVGHFAALSSDGATSWEEPFSTGTWAVDPKILALPGGQVALSSGRPGIGFWVTRFDAPNNASGGGSSGGGSSSSSSSDGDGGDGETFRPPTWQFFNINAKHNGLVSDPALKFPAADAAITNVTCPGIFPGSPAGTRTLCPHSSPSFFFFFS